MMHNPIFKLSWQLATWDQTYKLMYFGPNIQTHVFLTTYINRQKIQTHLVLISSLSKDYVC